MKILIVSNTPWNTENSFGNTFTNLFNGIEDLEIYNICSSNGSCDNPVTKGVYQMTVKAVTKSIFKKHTETGWVVKQNNDTSNNQEMAISKKLRKGRSNIAIICRDILWKLGHWKKSKSLNDFIKEVNPDILYLPIYATWYLCDIQEYVIKKCNVPIVGHISDDLYSYPRGYVYSPVFWFYRLILRKKLRKLIRKCSYLEVFAKNMQEEYSKIFNKPCYLIGKGVEPNDIIKGDNKKDLNESINFVYTGNIGSDRYKSLYLIGKALDNLQNIKKAKLIIYSATSLNKKMKKTFAKCKSIEFMGSVSGDKIKDIQQNADFLVHVESFSKKAIFETKMSLSTKIIDYLCLGKPVLAVGPTIVNSISFLRDNNLSITATTEKEVEKQILNIFNCNIDYSLLYDNVYNYLIENRDINKIQKEIYSRLENLKENINESASN